MEQSRKKWKPGEFIARIAELQGVPKELTNGVDARKEAEAELKSGNPKQAAQTWLKAAPQADEPYLYVARAADILLSSAPIDVRIGHRGWPKAQSRIGAQIKGLALVAAGMPNEGEDALIESLDMGPIDVDAALTAARCAARIDRGVAETFLGELATRDVGPAGREAAYTMLDELAAPPPAAHAQKKKAADWLVKAMTYSSETEGASTVIAPNVATSHADQSEMDRARSVAALIRHLEGEPDDSARSQGGSTVGRRYLRWHPAGRWQKTKFREHPKIRPGIHLNDQVPVLELQVILHECREPSVVLIYLGHQQHRRVNRFIDRRTAPAELLEMLRDQDLPMFMVPTEKDGKLSARIPLIDLMPEHGRSHPGDTILVLSWPDKSSPPPPEPQPSARQGRQQSSRRGSSRGSSRRGRGRRGRS